MELRVAPIYFPLVRGGEGRGGEGGRVRERGWRGKECEGERVEREGMKGESGQGG